MPGSRDLSENSKFKRLFSGAKAPEPKSPRSPPYMTIGDNLPIRHPTPEDYNAAIKMDSEYAETSRNQAPPLSPTLAANLVGHHPDAALRELTTDYTTPGASTEKMITLVNTDGSYTAMHSTPPMRDDNLMSEDDYCNFEHQGSRSARNTRSVSEPYELEAVPSKIVGEGIKAFSDDFLGRSHNRGKERDGRISRHSTARPISVKGMGSGPATAIRHPKASEATSEKRHRPDKGSNSDPFLGTGRSMNTFLSLTSNTTSTSTPGPLSPSPLLLRSNQLGGTPGLLNLHDAHEEVVSLLNTLKTMQRKQTKNEVDAALRKCQEDLKGRSKDKTIGTAEANILDREAARIGRARDEASKQTPETDMASSPGGDAVFEVNLRLALTKLIEDARAALEAMVQEKDKTASASRSTARYHAYSGAEYYRLKAIDLEKRTLEDQVERLSAEQEQVRKENSDLNRTLEQLKAHRQDEPMDTLGPWGKEWSCDSRRGV